MVKGQMNACVKKNVVNDIQTRYEYGGSKMKKRTLILVIMTVFVLLTLTGCIPGDGSASVIKPAGFLWGIWHGWVAPVSLIMGLFNDNIRVYEVFNSGWWYDFGFYMAVISGFGGLALFRKKGSKHK